MPITSVPITSETSPRVLTLDTIRLEPFEIGAILMSILAFPRRLEEESFRRAAEALCSDVVRTTIANSPEEAAAWRAAYPAYSAIDEAESRRRLRTLKRRLRDRMVASRMSLGFFQEALSRESARLPDSMARLSLNELSKLVQRQSGQSDPENVERRAWHDSRPVIHLAAAMQILARAFAPDLPGLGYPLDNGPLHRASIELAQLHEQIVLSDQRFGVEPADLVRIRSVPAASN